MDKSTIIQFVIGLCLIVAFVTRICFFQSFDSYMKDYKKSEPQSSKKLKSKRNGKSVHCFYSIYQYVFDKQRKVKSNQIKILAAFFEVLNQM